MLAGPALLHATDVVAVNYGAGRVVCSSFNLVGNRVFSGSSVRASIRINGHATDLMMLQNAQGLHFEFPGGSLIPDNGLLGALSLSFGLNTLEFRIGNDGSPLEEVIATAALWMWTTSDRIVVVDIDGTWPAEIAVLQILLSCFDAGICNHVLTYISVGTAGTVTKSDVRGLLANHVQGTASFLSNALAASNPWTSEAILNTARSADYNHEGVADAISYIASKGYRILYLTARPISMAAGSRTYLATVSQGSEKGLESKMPEGALITQVRPPVALRRLLPH